MTARRCHRRDTSTRSEPRLLATSPSDKAKAPPHAASAHLEPLLQLLHLGHLLAQLLLLFAAFVLAVPMFVVVIQFTGLISKDEEQAKKYDSLAYEFTKLLTTAFSITSILGAVFTFCLIGLYPRLFGYLAEVF